MPEDPLLPEEIEFSALFFRILIGFAIVAGIGLLIAFLTSCQPATRPAPKTDTVLAPPAGPIR